MSKRYLISVFLVSSLLGSFAASLVLVAPWWTARWLWQFIGGYVIALVLAALAWLIVFGDRKIVARMRGAR